MRKIPNLMKFHFPTYCRARGFINGNLHHCMKCPKIRTTFPLVNLNVNSTRDKLTYSTAPPSGKVSDESIKELLEEYPEPKQIVQRVILEAFLITEDFNIKPQLSSEKMIGDGNNKPMWHTSLKMHWPNKFEVKSVAQKKADAERIAYLLACQKLKEYGHLNNKNEPVIPNAINSEELRFAKGYLCNIFNRIWARLGNQSLIPEFKTTQEEDIFNAKNIWRTRLTLKYPELKIFDGFAKRSNEAEKIASLKALKWLFEKGIINSKKQFVSYLQEELDELEANHNLPSPFQIPDELQSTMYDTLKSYICLKQNNKNLFAQCLDESSEECTKISDPVNIITEKPYRSLTDEETKLRNSEMFQKLELLSKVDELKKIQANRLNFPIAEKRQDILNLIDNNQVVVLSGETGCGKTTQVPQYILDSFIASNKGSECNIVVTQPRRISAITVADFVASERGEQVGETIGHQVRLNKCLPSHGHGAILYCSTGMLLRKLIFNPNLEGISHIIVDEVHERSMQIDFLLIILKELLEQNKNIKLIIMSATFNTMIFSHYFNNCPVIHIPGKIYPVQEYFLEDIARFIKIDSSMISKTQFDAVLFSDVIKYVDSVEPSGAILCFLPGWNEILAVSDELNKKLQDPSKYFICPLHSRLLPSEQKQAFKQPPEGVRKIVLATNVAECSITINDVVCVVDSGLQKGTTFDNLSGTSSLGMQWITKANVRQRRGRAGRLRPGTCYYIFPSKIFMKMNDYPTPEIQRISLEKVVLDCKLYCPNTKAEDFLSLAVQPPSRSSIQMGVQELQVMGVLDQNENLTTLGKAIVPFATHPRLSKALVYATFLRCLDPVLTISAFLTISQDVFGGTLGRSEQIKKIKQRFCQEQFSDHLAFYDLFCKWDSLNAEEKVAEKEEFLANTKLDNDTLVYIKQLKGLFAENIYESGLIDNVHQVLDMNSILNQNSQNSKAILSSLASGFYPNIIKIQQGEVSKGSLNRDIITYSTLNGQPAFIQQDSLASKEDSLPSPWLIYFSTLKSEARSALLMSELSPVDGICLLLFSGQDLLLKTKSNLESMTENEVKLLIDDNVKLSFLCSENDAELISDWRHCLLEILQAQLKTRKNQENQTVLRDFLDSNIFPILTNVLQTPQVPFVKGKKYVTENGEIVLKDLYKYCI